jgi:hypothetical protein
MPWEIRKAEDGQYHVYNQETGKDEGGSDTREMAIQHLRALYATDPGDGGPKKGHKKW